MNPDDEDEGDIGQYDPEWDFCNPDNPRFIGKGVILEKQEGEDVTS